MTELSTARPLRVVLATDGDQAADEAAELLTAVADRDAHVDVVSVVPTGTPMLRHLHGRMGPIDERRHHARTVAQAAADELRRAGFDADLLTPEGRPSAVLAQGIGDTDLVVIGATNHGPGARLFGSVSEAVMSRASTAVLIVRDVVTAAPTEVLVAVDDEHRAAATVDLVVRLLDPHRTRITVLGVAELLAPAFSPPHIRYADAAPDDDSELTVDARGHVAKAAARLRAHGFDVEDRVVVGEPIHRILAEVADRSAGMVVLGGRGLGAVEGALLGSVSRAVLAKAPATLVVPG